ncbi:MAG TPA: sulfatase [Luteolibacter sp.]|nr:sulfatase [Luteolibacter sp.]
MKRILLLSCLWLAALSAWAQESATKPSTPMNVVVLLADDWRYDTLGVAGNPIVKTPNIDRLAAEGVRFTDSCVTTSICGVSRASILTGQWMSRHGNMSFKAFKTPWAETYPGIMRANGYHVGHVGKWHCGKIPEDQFDFCRSYHGKHWMKDENDQPIHVTQKNLKDAMDFLDTRPKDKPFLLNLCFFAPHAEDGNPKQYLPQEKSMELYKDVTIPDSPTRNENALHRLPPFLQGEANEGRIRYHWRFDTDQSYQEMMKNYYRLCSEVDDVCGQVIERLRKEGVLDNTLIIFTGDNGYFHGDYMLADKWYPYQQSIRVPMIVRDPRLPAGTRGTTRPQFVLNVDIAPTILAATGMKQPGRMQGTDFSGLYLAAQAPAWREQFFYEFGAIGKRDHIPASQCVVTRSMKYTLWPEWQHEQLFDLGKDPQELDNRLEDPAYAKSLAEMRATLEKLKEQAR